MLKRLLLTLVLLSASAFAQTCRANQLDMVDWMAPTFDSYQGHFNVVYPASGTFYWIKGAPGYPWDVDLFDSKYVYQSITEQDWNNPQTFKIFEQAMPWTPRCIDVPATPGKLTQIKLAPAQTKFDIHSSCSAYVTHSLGYVINEVWGPNSEGFGKLAPAPTLTLSYRYSCESDFDACKAKETFAFQKGPGLVAWTSYVLQSGETYVQIQQVIHDSPAVPATITPIHHCW